MTTIPSPDSSTPSTLHFIGGEKGGVGKSLTARLLAQHFIDTGKPFVGFDTDRSHGALLRFYGDYASSVIVDRYEALDALVESALEEPGRRVLVDLAAQTQAPLVRWIEDSGVLELASEHNLRINYWHVMDAGRDSADLLGRLLDLFGDRVNYILVRNQLRGDDFRALEASGAQARAETLGARTMTLKRLHETVAQKIDLANASFWAAKNLKGGELSLGLLERQRLKLWLAHVTSEFERLDV